MLEIERIDERDLLRLVRHRAAGRTAVRVGSGLPNLAPWLPAIGVGMRDFSHGPSRIAAC